MKKQVNIQVSGKILISGEHSVVYNNTALSCAIDKYLLLSVFKSEKNIIVLNNDELIINNLDQLLNLSIHDLRDVCKKYYGTYYGTVVYGIVISCKALNIVHDLSPLCIKIISDIQMSVGFGTSAMVANAIINGLVNFFDIQIDKALIHQIGLDIENFIHQNSSGIDIYTINNGGFVLFDNGHRIRPNYNLSNKIIYIINTGARKFHTGDVIKYIREQNFSEKLWQEWRALTLDIYNNYNDQNKFNELISQNQYLLEYIGIVPKNILYFIKKVNSLNIAIKLSGAGTIGSLDDKCGNLIILDNLDANRLAILKELCIEYNFYIEERQIDYHGTQVI